MTNLVSLADKLLWNLEELLDFFGHYAKRRMNDRSMRKCVVRVKQGAADVSFSGPLNSLTLSPAAPMHVLTDNIPSTQRSFSTLAPF